MPKLPLRFARGANSALSKCPVCDGGLDMISSGEGPALCPWCDSALSYDKFQLRLDTSIKAAAGDGLTPHERRIARQSQAGDHAARLRMKCRKCHIRKVQIADEKQRISPNYELREKLIRTLHSECSDDGRCHLVGEGILPMKGGKHENL